MPNSQSSFQQKLAVGLVLRTVNGRQMTGQPLADVTATIKAAGRPLSMTFAQFSVPKAEKHGNVQITFDRPGPIGLSFEQCIAIGRGQQQGSIVRVMGVAPGSYASTFREIHEGMVVMSVQGFTGRNIVFKELMDYIKTGVRPLDISFESKQLATPVSPIAPMAGEKKAVGGKNGSTSFYAKQKDILLDRGKVKEGTIVTLVNLTGELAQYNFQKMSVTAMPSSAASRARYRVSRYKIDKSMKGEHIKVARNQMLLEDEMKEWNEKTEKERAQAQQDSLNGPKSTANLVSPAASPDQSPVAGANPSKSFSSGASFAVQAMTQEAVEDDEEETEYGGDAPAAGLEDDVMTKLTTLSGATMDEILLLDEAELHELMKEHMVGIVQRKRMMTAVVDKKAALEEALKQAELAIQNAKAEQMLLQLKKDAAVKLAEGATAAEQKLATMESSLMPQIAQVRSDNKLMKAEAQLLRVELAQLKSSVEDNLQRQAIQSAVSNYGGVRMPDVTPRAADHAKDKPNYTLLCELDNGNKVSLNVTGVDSLQAVRNQIKQQLALPTEIKVLIWDEDFDEYALMSEIDELPAKARVRVKAL